MSKFDKGRMGDNSSKTMLEAVDEQLDMLAELIVHFLNAVDSEEDLYLLVALRLVEFQLKEYVRVKKTMVVIQKEFMERPNEKQN